MDGEKIAKNLGEVLEEDGHREKIHGMYHPSTISGCPLKAFLNRMTDETTTLNRWLFQGSAVHYYLQEKPDLLTEALWRSGYHPLNTDYEVHTLHEINDGVTITGTCDILTHGDDSTSVIDIKYSSIPPYSGHGRLYKYASQVNCYANMFGADYWGLLMINSKSDNIPEDIAMIDNETDRENFNLVRQKAVNIHNTLEEFGYDEGERLEPSTIKADMMDVWKRVFQYIRRPECPSYEKECQYCSHSQYCPVKQGEMGGLEAIQ